MELFKSHSLRLFFSFRSNPFSNAMFVWCHSAPKRVEFIIQNFLSSRTIVIWRLGGIFLLSNVWFHEWEREKPSNFIVPSAHSTRSHSYDFLFTGQTKHSKRFIHKKVFQRDGIVGWMIFFSPTTSIHLSLGVSFSLLISHLLNIWIDRNVES